MPIAPANPKGVSRKLPVEAVVVEHVNAGGVARRLICVSPDTAQGGHVHAEEVPHGSIDMLCGLPEMLLGASEVGEGPATSGIEQEEMLSGSVGEEHIIIVDGLGHWFLIGVRRYSDCNMGC